MQRIGKKVPYCAMEDCHISKILRGLEVKDLKVFYKALLDKWMWRFGVKVQALWREVIADKYGIMEGSSRIRAITLPFGRELWRNIMKGLDYFSEKISSRSKKGEE